MPNKVLVVDDAQEVLDLMRAMLEEQGYEVVTAQNGIEGLRMVQSSQPDLIIADVLMPEMDGFSFFKELKKSENTSKIPVIILTARSKMEDSFRVVGVDGFLTKPINADSLLTQVKNEIDKVMPGVASVPGHSTQEDTPTVEDAPSAQDAPGAIETEVLPDAATAEGKKKVLIFGTNRNVVADMARLFARENCYPVVVQEQRKIVSTAEILKPRLSLLQLVFDTQVSMDETVRELSSLLGRKEYAPEEAENSLNIILYKVEEEMQGVTSMGADLADIQELLERCYNNGCSKYIGSFSSLSFMMKIKEFLE